jgi:uncharacterized protein YwgA
MRNHKKTFSDPEKVARIIIDAGGKIVGRTRLQKLAYFLEAAGVGEGFFFEYRHYGPFSESLAMAARNAYVLGLVEEEEKATDWGGFYSIYSAKCSSEIASTDNQPRMNLIKLAVEADPVALELAATAAFLSKDGIEDPWEETERRKSDKAKDGRLEKAKALYAQLACIPTPRRLPQISAM